MNIAIVGAGNIGTLLAARLRKQHALLLIDRRKAPHIETFLSQNPSVRFVQADALQENELTPLLANIDVLVCTVGTFSAMSALDSVEGFQSEFETNFFGNLIPIKAVLPGMIQRNRGQILVVSSTSGHLSPGNLTSYAPAKWALENLCSALHSEAAHHGIKVSWVAPKTLRNKTSEVFTFEKGMNPERVAGKLAKLIQNNSSGHYFVPALYRSIHSMERLTPQILNGFYGLKGGSLRRQRYRGAEIRDVLITGATSGLGHALAERYARTAKALYLVGRNGERLKEIKKQLESQSPCHVYPVQLDLSDSSAVSTFLDTFLGDIDLLINNAGFHVHGQVADTPVEMYRKNLCTSFYSPVRLISGLLKKSRRPKKIINVLSTTAISGREFHSAYSASKAALWSFSRSLRRMVGNDIQILEALPATFQSNLFLNGVRIPGQRTESQQAFSAKLLESAEVAERIQLAEQQGRDAVLIPFEARLFLTGEALLPSLFRRVFR